MLVHFIRNLLTFNAVLQGILFDDYFVFTDVLYDESLDLPLFTISQHENLLHLYL